MMPWFLGNSDVFDYPMRFGWTHAFTLGPLFLWSLVWTGLSLWHAARRGERGWFIFFLLVHTAGILEILYLVFVAKAFVSSSKRSSRISSRSSRKR